MGIEKLKGSLLSEANEDAQRIVETAQAHIQNMLKEEQSKGSILAKEAEKTVDALLNDQHNERVAWARLESKRIISEAKEDAIRGILDELIDALGSVRKSPEYKKFIKDATVNAIDELAGSGNDGLITIHVLKGDKALLPSIKNARIIEDLEGLGGIIVESGNGKIRVNGTIETLFETKKEDIRKHIYEKLFGGK